MKNKKKITIIIISVLVILAGFLIYYVFTAEDSKTSLNLIERQWIEKNKNNLIDFSVVSDVPILSNNGEGVVMDFLESLKEETELSFNMVSYRLGEEATTSYSVKIVDELNDNQILIYTDNYVVITKESVKYTDVTSLEGMTIGVLNDNVEAVSADFNGLDIAYKTYENIESMVADTNLNGMVVLKTSELDTIILNDYNISYNIVDLKKHYVIELGEEERLNDILRKYYEVWSTNNLVDSFGSGFLNTYVDIKDISSSDIVNFRSKRYVYGYLENAPFDTVFDGKLAGINNQLLSQFSKFTNSEISYKSYNTVSELVQDFNENKLDFYYNVGQTTEYSIDTIKTVDVYDNNLVILAHVNSVKDYTTISALNSVSLVKESYIGEYISGFNVSSKHYNNIDKLIDSNDEFLAVDLQNYNYYKNDLDNYVVVDIIDVDNSNFVIRDINDNALFIDLFSFYITYMNESNIINIGLDELLNLEILPYILKNVAIILGSLFGIFLVVVLILKVKPQKKDNLSKEDKIKYTDALTSLKNRNYLNNSIDKWDNSEIYPQTIIVLDLKNIAYINDNYGHTEGDLVIKQAANVLIVNQLENSEIIRTSGNEFLIYMLGYNEKQVITHIRKLNKELKDIKHGFGSAIGYSMITDAIKTVDDAINEASLDMRNNKEDISE